jgi:hypothetical protein
LMETGGSILPRSGERANQHAPGWGKPVLSWQQFRAHLGLLVKPHAAFCDSLTAKSSPAF